MKVVVVMIFSLAVLLTLLICTSPHFASQSLCVPDIPRQVMSGYISSTMTGESGHYLWYIGTHKDGRPCTIREKVTVAKYNREMYKNRGKEND